MMKIKLEVELDTNEDIAELKILQNCRALACGCEEFSNFLRSLAKHDDSLDEKQHELLDKIRDKFFEECGEYL